MQSQIIRAKYDRHTLTVYQAFNKLIAQAAVQAQKFVAPPFKKERMTWIKPSFLWMMYRSGWGTKKDQENILAIKMKREGFEWALANSCLSHFDESIYGSFDEWKCILNSSPVRIQWDPERNTSFQPLTYRTIQIGLSGIAVEKYIADWIVQIDDITDNCTFIHSFVKQNTDVSGLLPKENIYRLPKTIALRINSSLL